jgi:hypothetical protein
MSIKVKTGFPITRFLAVFLLVLGLALTGWAEEKKAPALTKKDKKEVIGKVSELLNKNYIFPETAKKIEDYLKKKLKKGQYKKLNDVDEFSRQLTEDLREVSKDKHLWVRHDPDMVKRLRKYEKNDRDPDVIKRMLRYSQRRNFGFQEVKILSGNIGYLDLRSFEGAEHGGATAVAAMNFLANCDALIIDLRRNGGGSPEMIQLISSYLFEGKSVHLNSFYWRPDDKHTQTWTLPHVPGKRIPDVPVYVLTSKRTFSAAEEFSYNLRNLKRGTLVGEVTGGGAHPGGPKVIDDHFCIGIPTGRAINPITKTNWEGVGVKPHIEVAQEKALATAKIKALEKLVEATKDEKDKKWYSWHIQGIKAELKPFKIDEATLKSYAGSFGPRKLIFKNGMLYYQREDRPLLEMTPMSKVLFSVEGYDWFRLKVIVEDGVVKVLQGLYDNGQSDKNVKDKEKNS